LEPFFATCRFLPTKSPPPEFRPARGAFLPNNFARIFLPLAVSSTQNPHNQNFVWAAADLPLPTLYAFIPSLCHFHPANNPPNGTGEKEKLGKILGIELQGVRHEENAVMGEISSGRTERNGVVGLGTAQCKTKCSKLVVGKLHKA
ncbi:hypothetical protein T11_5601, partial [Trichinella zimbabwensis]